jgi:hypothetical protein
MNLDDPYPIKNFTNKSISAYSTLRTFKFIKDLLNIEKSNNPKNRPVVCG